MYMKIFSYDMAKGQIEDNSYIEWGIKHCYKIGQLFLDFVNADFSKYDLNRKKVLKYRNECKHSERTENLEDFIKNTFPEINSQQLEFFCSQRYGMCLDVLADCLLNFKNPYCSMAETYFDMHQFKDHDNFDFLGLQKKILSKYIPCLDTDTLGSQFPVEKYMRIFNKAFSRIDNSFEEVTIFRYKYTMQEEIQYDIDTKANKTEFTLLSEDEIIMNSNIDSNIELDFLKSYPECATRGIEIIHGYHLNSAEEALKCEFLKMLELNVKVRKCQICGKYFIISKHNGKCCDNLYKNTGLTCQQIFANKNYMKKKKEHPILKEYNKAYKRMYARLSNKKITQREFADWLRSASEYKDKYYKLYGISQTQYIIDEFKRFLGNK